jgi:hypothetical protein
VDKARVRAAGVTHKFSHGGWVARGPDGAGAGGRVTLLEEGLALNAGEARAAARAAAAAALEAEGVHQQAWEEGEGEAAAAPGLNRVEGAVEGMVSGWFCWGGWFALRTNAAVSKQAGVCQRTQLVVLCAVQFSSRLAASHQVKSSPLGLSGAL